MADCSLLQNLFNYTGIIMAGYKQKMVDLTSRFVSTIPHVVLRKMANQKMILPF